MFPVVSRLDVHLVLRAQSGAHVKLRRRKYIFIYAYLFIYLFICLFIFLFKVGLHITLQQKPINANYQK